MRRGSCAPDVDDGRPEALGPRGDSDAGGAGQAEAADGASLCSTPQTPSCHGNSEADCEGVCLDSPASQCSATRTPMGPVVPDAGPSPVDLPPAAPAAARAARGPPDCEPDSEFLPNSLTIAGLQHIMRNLCNDVHTSLSHWRCFHAELKHFEGLLCMGERRQRYIWTCLRGTPFEGQSGRFERFTGSLYEARWKAVLQFLKS